MAAGLGFKDFTTGEVLTAADVDGYLMQGVWVFASAAARDAAVTSPQEGNFAYLKDTNVTTYYTGSAWANLDTTGMTNPMTTTGDIIYSSSGSTPARLGIGSTGNVLTVAGGVPSWAAPSAAGFVGVSLSNGTTTTQTISNATFTSLTFSTEDFDTDGFHSTVSNTSRITIPAGKDGKYQINYFGEYTTDSTSGNRFIYLAKNGTKIKRHAISRNNYGDITQANLQMTINLVATDYIEIQTFQSSGGNLDFLTYDGSTSTETVHFSATYLGA